MPDALQQAGALSEPSNFAPLHTNRIFTGLWSNRNPLRDAATNEYQERYGMGRQDSILGGSNSEISPRLTLRRRYGSSVYNHNILQPVNRFYSFNTFTTTEENIRVMADTATEVRDITVLDDGTGLNNLVFTKSGGAKSTYFLGVGNILYMANGVDNRQWVFDPTTGTGQIFNWGIAAPTDAPVATFYYAASYGAWQANVVFTRNNSFAPIVILDSNANIQNISTYGTTGTGDPMWDTRPFYGTQDGTAAWQNLGDGLWAPGTLYDIYKLTYNQASDGNVYFYQLQNAGTSGGGSPNWLAGIGSITTDGNLRWLNIGRIMNRDQIGNSTLLVQTNTILDANNNVQTCIQAGKSGATAPNFSQIRGGFTSDPTGNALGTIIWQNMGAEAAIQYGYAFMNSRTGDISNMSPASNVVVANDGNRVIVEGVGSPDSQADTIVLFRTLHGGSTFLYLTQFANPGGGQPWAYEDTTLDDDLNPEWQAQRTGEGTPLASGATALGYHLGRIFAAVGNVVWISSGPDAAVGGSSGNAGFNTFFTCQSKITRFWTCPLGMIVFTVRDAYVILGRATDADPLYMVVYIEDLPLRSYDCFTVNKTTPYMLLGNNTLLSLDPSAGIVEVGFPIADLLLKEFDPGIPAGQQRSGSFVTFHKESSLDTALYVANGQDHWYRMAAVNAPEVGSAWSAKAQFSNLGCVQSVEVKPGQYRLLMSGTSPGPILQRDGTKNTDNGQTYSVTTQFGIIVLALPGQLAVLSFLTLESIKVGSRAVLGLLLGELNGEFEQLKRTRQDPPILPPSDTIFSDRYHFAQNQKEAWCRHFQMEISWPPEDAPNELLTFTIFGQHWQETRSQ